MKLWFIDLVAKVLALLVALAAMQMPLFMQQYAHQLMGHASELRWQVDAMQKIAIDGGKSLPEYIDKFSSNSDGDIAQQGKFMGEMVQKAKSLTEFSQAFANAPALKRPWLFLKHLDFSIYRDTLAQFNPGIPLSLEGVAYGLLGLVVGSGVWGLLRAMVALLITTFSRRSSQS